MKISKARLQQIIKEERDAYLPQMGTGISPEEGAAELRKDMEELLGSELFSKADPKDQRDAAKKIYSTLIRTSFYGGENRFYEEILDDALGGYGSDLQQRLADAAGFPVVSWGEALSAWASGDEDFAKYADPDYEDEDIGYMQENKMKISKTRLQQIIKEVVAAVTEQKAEAKVDELMQSQLFSNADEKDKAEARSIILDTLKSLEAYGGTRRPSEEYMDDAFRPHTELTKRLADASPADFRSYWLDALVAWSLGRKDYEKLLYDEELS